MTCPEITQEEYDYLLAYTMNKALCAGEDESYIELLFPDVVKEYMTRKAINAKA